MSELPNYLNPDRRHASTARGLMQVMVCPEPGELTSETRAIPIRERGQVLIRIRRVGLCGTDYHIFRGTQPYLTYPRVMGHELAGEVVEGDEEDRFVPGAIVCVMPYLSCGSCGACRRGRTNCCTNLQVLGVHRDGGLAEYLAVDARFAIDAGELGLDQAAMVEFLAIGLHAVRRGRVTAGQKILIVGAGPIGMATALFSVLEGADVTVLDSNAGRARFCVEQLGARHWLTADDSARERLEQISAGDWFDVVFDATGSRRAIETGFSYVAHCGSYVLVSVVAADIHFNDPEFHKREMALLGSRNATHQDFAEVIDAIRKGKVPTAAMRTHGAPLAVLPEKLVEWMSSGAGVIKAIVEI